MNLANCVSDIMTENEQEPITTDDDAAPETSFTTNNTNNNDPPVHRWSAFYDEDGRLYYYNSVTEESAWEAPEEGFNPLEEGDDEPPAAAVAATGNDDQVQSSAKLDSQNSSSVEEFENAEIKTVYDWSAHYDDEGRLYYYNSVTEASAWEAPTEGFNPPEESDPAVAAVDTMQEQDLGNQEDDLNDALQTSNHDTEQLKAADVESGCYENVVVDSDNAVISRTAETAENDEGASVNKSPAEDLETEFKKAETTDNSSKKGDFEWSAHYDEEGRLYYYNSVTGESGWEAPTDGFNPPEEPSDNQESAGATVTDAPDEDENDGVRDTAWVAYTDEEGREYYYNLKSGESQWDKPEHYKKAPADEDDDDQAAAKDEVGGSVTKSPSTAYDDDERSGGEEVDMTKRSSRLEGKVASPDLEHREETIDPAVQRLQDAEAALNSPDSVLEPSCLANVSEVVEANGGNPAKAIAALIENYHGQTAVCGLLSRWLADLHKKKQDVSFKEAARKHPNLSNTNSSNVDKIRELAQSIINKMAKERFTKEAGDSILDLSKAKASFLEEMMHSSRWRKLLIDLSASHKDSAVLLYCLRAISKQGHHREIAKRINQSDHFAVFNAMLLSELSMIGSQAVSAGSDVPTAAGLEELVQDLTRACSSTSFTYLYSVEMLRRLEIMARAEIESVGDTGRSTISGNGAPDSHERFRRALRKWEALSQMLESSMVDPSVSQSVAGSSPLLQKRRVDVALTISDLHQRQRRRRRRITSNGCYHNDEEAERSDSLETALLTLLRRHAIAIHLDDAVLDKMLPSGLEMDTRGIGELLIQHPLAVRALLGHLYKPGPTRVNTPSTKNKCARLVALAMIAAEHSAQEESIARGTTPISQENPDELALTRMLVQGSQLCEQVETMISFLVTTDADKHNMSLGQKLCSLALKCAPVGLGVAIWAREFTHGKEYAASASFPTLSPSILSLVRLVALKHPFARADALQVALAFLRHSNPDISYQKVNSIKECSLRLLIFLLIKGDVVPVLSSVLNRIQQVGTSELDASLIRYLVGGVLEVVQPPLSPLFVRMFGRLLNASKVVDAVRSSYFAEMNRKRLAALLSTFKDVRLHDGAPLSEEDGSLVNLLHATYQLD